MNDHLLGSIILISVPAVFLIWILWRLRLGGRPLTSSGDPRDFGQQGFGGQGQATPTMSFDDGMSRNRDSQDFPNLTSAVGTALRLSLVRDYGWDDHGSDQISGSHDYGSHHSSTSADW